VRARRLKAMGTDIELFVDAEDADDALDRAEHEFHRLESLLSRFDPDSQLSRLNKAKSLVVAPEVARVVALAVEARERTGGRFDPTVLRAVAAAGYDRTFEHVLQDGPAPAAAVACGGRVHVDGTQIDLADDTELDLGGIGKGFAVERAACTLAAAGPCLVNAGGDLAVRSGAWPVGLETADGTITLELESGAIATSGRDRRRWRRAGQEQHHLIDPRTGAPARTDLLRVTVVAADAVEAEVWAKALFLAGEDEAAQEADALGLSTILVTEDGRTTLCGGLA
jgi:thiamine biosynthesis lipoprotein